MATETFDVIEGDGSSDQVTLTDDPVENATVQAVKNAIGDETTASEVRDAGVAATQIERLTAVVSVLMDVLAGGDASDRLRVGIQEQGGTLTVTDNDGFTLAANDGTDIGDVGIKDISPVTGQQSKSGSLPVTLASDEDTVHAEGDTSHDATDSGNPVKVGAVYAPSRNNVEEGDRTDLRSTEKGDVSIAPLHHGDDSVEARLPTLEDRTTATGSSNAAEIRATGGRTQVSVAWYTSGASTITVEVSSGGNAWFDRTHNVIPSQPASAERRAETFETGFRHVRVYADSSLNELLISAKGL
jgi:predicted RecA/RadA family phage recombinase